MAVADVDRHVLESLVRAVASSHSRLDAFARAALRMRVPGPRQVLSQGIAPDASLDELLAEVRATPAARIAERAPARVSNAVPANAVADWWRALARVVALQGLTATDRTDGLRLYEVARLLSPVSTWPTEDARAYAQLQWAAGDRERLRGDDDLLEALDAEDRDSILVDLEADAHGVGSAPWAHALARMLGPVPAVTADSGKGTWFDGLRPVEPPEPVDGPLVTVIMSAFRPGPEILTSVRSILDQSWTNVELIVVDDASGPEYAGILNHIAQLDPRVQILIQPENGGTYRARNHALTVARGEFITFQDSDDWSHPERIERQVRRMLDKPDLPAVMSRSIRCTPDLELQLLGHRTTRPNVSSLMLRRSTVEALGSFDHVRKAADSEYELRITAHYGRRVPVMSDLLAFVRLDPDSLSRSDFKPGWWHPARYAYRDSFRHWHRAVARGAAPWLAAEAEGRRFPAPRAFLRADEHGGVAGPLDLLYVADWREVGGIQSALVQHMREAAVRGSRIGIMHLESIRALDCGSDAVCFEISELQHEGTVIRVLPGDAVAVRRLVLSDPGLLTFPPAPMTAMHVEEVTILASTPPMTSSRDHRYAPAAVTHAATAIWGADPSWTPIGRSVRAALGGIDGVRLSPHDFSFALPSHLASPRTVTGDRPIIGTAVGFSEDDLPAQVEKIFRVIPDDDRIDVRLIATHGRASRVVSHIPRHWLVFHPGETAERDLFRQVQFFILPADATEEIEVVPRVIEAVSTGALVIVPPSFAEILGDAAIYAAPEEALEAAKMLFMKPDEYAAAVSRAQASLRRRFSLPSADSGDVCSTTDGTQR